METEIETTEVPVRKGIFQEGTETVRQKVARIGKRRLQLGWAATGEGEPAVEVNLDTGEVVLGWIQVRDYVEQEVEVFWDGFSMPNIESAREMVKQIKENPIAWSSPTEELLDCWEGLLKDLEE